MTTSEHQEKFNKVVERLEKLDKEFVIEGVPEEYKGVWTPTNQIKLWSVGRESAKILKLLALARRPLTILELGTSAGYSTIWLASAARQYGGHVYTVEMARPKIEMARESFQEAQLDSYITQIEGTIDQALDNWDRPIDFMFIDADKMNYLSYFKKVEPHLVPNAIVVADNASNFAEYMTDYLEHVTKNESYASYLINIEHGLMVTIKL